MGIKRGKMPFNSRRKSNFRKNDSRRRPSPESKEVRQVEEISEDESDVRGGLIEGRNPVMEAFRAGAQIDKVYLLEGSEDAGLKTIFREVKKHDTIYYFVSRERLDELSETGHHQGVVARVAAAQYAEVDDILEIARKKGEDPFIILLDDIEDPYNLGAIIRTANVSGAHGVIITKRHATGITPTVVKASAGAVVYTPVARVTNLTQTMKKLKDEGLWFVCADMDGEVVYKQNLTGPIGLVIGNEGSGVSPLVKKNCDFVSTIPVNGEIQSLNASVAAGVLSYEIVRQRMNIKK